MPLRHARTARTIRAAISANIRTEIKRGHPPRQAVAIAYGVARSDAKRAHIKMPSLRARLARFKWKKTFHTNQRQYLEETAKLQETNQLAHENQVAIAQIKANQDWLIDWINRKNNPPNF
jgi:hypothetical protein